MVLDRTGMPGRRTTRPIRSGPDSPVKGVGDPAGTIVGDGTRFLALRLAGRCRATSPSSTWRPRTACTGPGWHCEGNQPPACPGALEVFQMRDGVLISGDAGSWFATAATK